MSEQKKNFGFKYVPQEHEVYAFVYHISIICITNNLLSICNQMSIGVDDLLGCLSLLNNRQHLRTIAGLCVRSSQIMLYFSIENHFKFQASKISFCYNVDSDMKES